LTENEDCGTSEGLEVTLTKDNYKAYIFRYTTEGQRLESLEEDKWIGQTVKLRSPIFCKETTGICRTCYPHYDVYQSKRVGFITAQSIGEPGTQLIMRTFHTGGAAEAKVTDLPDVVAVSEDDTCIASVPLIIELESGTVEEEEIPLDPDMCIQADLELSITWEEGSTSLTLPKGTQLLLKSTKFGKTVPAGTPLFKFFTSAQDLATDLAIVRRLLDTSKALTHKEAIQMMYQLQGIYNAYQKVLSIHFELLWAERMRTLDGRYTRFDDIKADDLIKLESISSIPHSRLLLSLCFENFRKFFRTFMESVEITYSPLEILMQSDLKRLLLDKKVFDAEAAMDDDDFSDKLLESLEELKK
jgi:RNA polymerase Rpb1, domain 5